MASPTTTIMCVCNEQSSSGKAYFLRTEITYVLAGRYVWTPIGTITAHQNNRKERFHWKFNHCAYSEISIWFHSMPFQDEKFFFPKQHLIGAMCSHAVDKIFRLYVLVSCSCEDRITKVPMCLTTAIPHFPNSNLITAKSHMTRK